MLNRVYLSFNVLRPLGWDCIEQTRLLKGPELGLNLQAACVSLMDCFILCCADKFIYLQ